MSAKRALFSLVGVFALTGFLLATAPTPADEPKPDKDGFVPLFNGKDLDGWKVGDKPDSWSVKDGQIVVHGPGPSHLFYVGPVHNHDWKNFWSSSLLWPCNSWMDSFQRRFAFSRSFDSVNLDRM